MDLLRWRKREKPLVRKDFSTPFNVLSEPPTADYRGIPTLECPCGCEWLIMCAQIDPETRLPGFILLDALCASCGALVTLPTPVDDDMYLVDWEGRP